MTIHLGNDIKNLIDQYKIIGKSRRIFCNILSLKPYITTIEVLESISENTKFSVTFFSNFPLIIVLNWW